MTRNYFYCVILARCKTRCHAIFYNKYISVPWEFYECIYTIISNALGHYKNLIPLNIPFYLLNYYNFVLFWNWNIFLRPVVPWSNTFSTPAIVFKIKYCLLRSCKYRFRPIISVTNFPRILKCTSLVIKIQMYPSSQPPRVDTFVTWIMYARIILVTDSYCI